MISMKMLAAEKFVDTYGDDWVARFIGDGLPTALLGIVTVFVVLSIIWGFLEVFRYVFYTVPQRNKENGASAPSPKAQSLPAQSRPVVQSTNDAEVVAAIVAAITAMRADENIASPSSFRVVSFRKR